MVWWCGGVMCVSGGARGPHESPQWCGMVVEEGRVRRGGVARHERVGRAGATTADSGRSRTDPDVAAAVAVEQVEDAVDRVVAHHGGRHLDVLAQHRAELVEVERAGRVLVVRTEQLHEVMAAAAVRRRVHLRAGGGRRSREGGNGGQTSRLSRGGGKVECEGTDEQRAGEGGGEGSAVRSGAQMRATVGEGARGVLRIARAGAPFSARSKAAAAPPGLHATRVAACVIERASRRSGETTQFGSTFARTNLGVQHAVRHDGATKGVAKAPSPSLQNVVD